MISRLAPIRRACLPSLSPSNIAVKFTTTRLVSLLLLLTTSAALAQDSPQMQTLRELNLHVWEPFVRGVNTYDHALYSRVRSKDSIFVDGKRFFGYEAYVEDAIRVMTPIQKAGTQLNMQVRFEERTTDGVYASERGVLRSVVTDASGVERTSHARFHVISRKQPDGWRIVTDYRWRTGAEADAKAFAAARMPEDVETFR